MHSQHAKYKLSFTFYVLSQVKLHLGYNSNYIKLFFIDVPLQFVSFSKIGFSFFPLFSTEKRKLKFLLDKLIRYGRNDRMVRLLISNH